MSKNYYSLRRSTDKFNSVNSGEFSCYKSFMVELNGKGRIINRLSKANGKIENLSAEEAGIALLQLTKYLQRGYAARSDITVKEAIEKTRKLLSDRIERGYESMQTYSPERDSLKISNSRYSHKSLTTKLGKTGFASRTLVSALGILLGMTTSYLAGNSRGHIQGYAEGINTSREDKSEISPSQNQDQNETVLVSNNIVPTPQSYDASPIPIQNIPSLTQPLVTKSEDSQKKYCFEMAKFLSNIPFSDLTSARVVRVNDKISRLEDTLESPYYADGLVDSKEEVEGIVNSVSLSFKPASSDLRFANPKSFEQILERNDQADQIREYETQVGEVTPWDLAVQLNQAFVNSVNSPRKIIYFIDSEGNERVIGSARELQNWLEESR